MNLLSRDCVIVFGVPGVGKSTACEGFASRHPAFLYCRASALLSAARGQLAATLRTSGAHEIESNQKLLGQELEALRRRHPDRSLLIDGHAVIDNDHQLVRVPIDAVALMRPTGIGLLEATPEAVLLRRCLAHRDYPQRTIAEIAREIAAEYETVVSYAEKLDVPLEIRVVSEGFTLEETIAALRRKRRTPLG